MSVGRISRPASRSSAARHTGHSRHTPPPSALTPENKELGFEPSAATGSFFLYAQRNTILVLHHDTLAIERRFELHHEDVLWISVDNVSERGAGRLAVSYDSGHTAIVWDILSGGEVARFAAYDQINVAAFMRNGNIAFGNVKGSIILFEPSTSEHINTRTIFDPITALAPSADCTTFAIGYLNGSILVATLQPAFTILHTLTTSRAPSRIAGLAWHGSSSKQRTDMLATQTLDGDMRVWSVPKVHNPEPPNIIRVLSRSDYSTPGACWFAWSKNGRIVQHADGETRSWDVRTKKVTYEVVPTVENLTSIAIYGPGATLFTLGRNHTVQQYDVSPSNPPMQVASVQHVPANTPPTPPTLLEERRNPYADAEAFANNASVLPTFTDAESSADEGAALSPMQKIAKEMDSLELLESELRDKVMPLSPTSSRASSVSSRSSGGGRRQRKYLYDRPSSSRASVSTGADETEFSFGGAQSTYRRNHDSMSIKSGSTRASNARYRSSNLRKEVVRSPVSEGPIDLFPFLKHRVKDVPFRTPHYGNMARTTDLLQREMLSTVFGWNEDITSLIREELSRHSPGSATFVLLSKWLGDTGTDNMNAMIGSDSMTSSDWMLLALSSIGADSQKKVGEAFVQRLLEKGDVHPAVAILLGLGEHNDAIEVYVSQSYFMEAVLLTALLMPHDWGRLSHMLRKWGEVAVKSGQPELAVRCFSVCSVESSEPWRSPRAQDAAYAAQQERFMQPLSAGPITSPPISPPSRSGSGRIANINPSLKLITTFGDKGAVQPSGGPTPLAAGVTPIAESALSPSVTGKAWPRASAIARTAREPASARTATPGGYTRRKRLPSRSDIERARQEAAEMETPMTAQRDRGSKPPSVVSRSRRASEVSGAGEVEEPTTALKGSHHHARDRLAPSEISVDNSMDDSHLPSPAQGAFARLRDGSRNRGSDASRKPDGLEIKVVDTRYSSAEFTPAPSTHDLESVYSRMGVQQQPIVEPPRESPRTLKAKAIDAYIDNVEAARHGEGRKRGESRKRQDGPRQREASSSRGMDREDYIKPAKKSPSSPVPMSPEEIAKASQRGDNSMEAEDFYKLASPTESSRSAPFGRKESVSGKRGQSRDGRSRGRSDGRTVTAAARSPSAPVQTLSDRLPQQFENDVESEGRRSKARARSSSRKPDDLQSRRAASRSRPRERSSSRRPATRAEDAGEQETLQPMAMGQALTVDSQADRRPRTMSRKELAARELEERRLSLARRPSAPAIPLPGEFNLRPSMSPRAHTDLAENPSTFLPPFSRSHTVDPEAMMRHQKITGTSTPSAPIGLPATPRAMRHPKYMGSDVDKDDAPPVPNIPGNFTDLSSNLSGYNSSQLSTNLSSSSQQTSSLEQNGHEDDIAPLLPSTVFGQKVPQPPGRSASAPPEKLMGGMPAHPAYKAGIPSSNRRQSLGKHVRKISPPEVPSMEPRGNIDEALHLTESQVSFMSEEEPPPMLPELQHLAGPPPPPPAPTMYSNQAGTGSGFINIAIDDNAPDAPVSLPQPMERIERSMTTSPSAHRRGRGSVSESLGSRFRGFGDRVRASSRGASRAKSPPVEHRPYETVIPGIPTHLDRAKSPYEQAMASQTSLHNAPHDSQIPPPPPPPPAPPVMGMEGKLSETVIPPRNQIATGGYRNPKEIRANMPPETLQQGVYQPMQQGGFL